MRTWPSQRASSCWASMIDRALDELFIKKADVTVATFLAFLKERYLKVLC